MGKKTGSIDRVRKKVTKTYEFISTSYHEAGHTIYALLHLMKVSSVSVFENKKIKRIHGLTYYDCPIDLESIKSSDLLYALVRADIGMSYAGLIAEKSLFRSISGSRRTPMFIIDGSADDYEEARIIIKKYDLAPPGPKRTLYKRKLMKEVRRDLHAHWNAVTLVAHALFNHHRLNFDELRTLLTTKSTNKKFWKEQFKKVSYFYANNKRFDEKDLQSILSS